MIITGCQRSGTATIAHIFGLTHEEIINPLNLTTWNIEELLPKIGRGEATWLAAPYVALLRKFCKVIHLVRHPLAVINSLEGIEFWTLTKPVMDGHAPYRDFIFKHLPDILAYKDVIEKSLFYWLEWNQILGRQSLPRIRIEDWCNVPKLNSRPRANYDWADIKRLEAVSTKGGNTPLSLAVETLAKSYYYDF